MRDTLQAIELEAEIDDNHEIYQTLPTDVKAGKDRILRIGPPRSWQTRYRN
jgi:hypothetical protein